MELILYSFGIFIICFVLYQLLLADPVKPTGWLITKKRRVFRDLVHQMDASLSRIRERHRSDYNGTVLWTCRTKRFPFDITFRRGAPHEISCTFHVKAPQIPEPLEMQLAGTQLEIQPHLVADTALREILERLRYFDRISIRRNRITIQKEIDSARDMEKWPDALGGALTLCRYMLDYEESPPLPENAICPYCKAAIAEKQTLVFCKECHTIHHQECWDETDQCTVFGCTGKIPLSKA